MTAQEMFSLFSEYPEDQTFVTGIFKEFMYVETQIAELKFISFSDLDQYQEIESRTCKVCGKVSCTSIYGNQIEDCTNESCALVRKYFNIVGNFRCPLPAATCGKKGNYTIANWFRMTLEKTFGVKQIYRIPIEKRLDVLLAMMLIRKTMDKDHEVIEKLAA